MPRARYYGRCPTCGREAPNRRAEKWLVLRERLDDARVQVDLYARRLLLKLDAKQRRDTMKSLATAVSAIDLAWENISAEDERRERQRRSRHPPVPEVVCESCARTLYERKDPLTDLKARAQGHRARCACGSVRCTMCCDPCPA